MSYYIYKSILPFLLLYLAQPAIACSPEAEDAISKGIVFLNSADLDSAESYFRSAKIADSECLTPDLYLGRTYLLKAGELKKQRKYDHVGPVLGVALRSFQKVLKLDSVNISALTNIGMVYYELNRFEIASFYFQKVLRYQPENHIALQNMGNAKFWLNKDADYNEAIRYWQRALNIPSIPTANAAVIWKNIGIAYYKSAGIDSALAAFGKSISLDPSIADSYVWYGRALATEGQSDGAIANYKTAIELDPLCIEAYAGWAEVLFMLKDELSYTYKDKTKEFKDRINNALESSTFAKAKLHLYLGHVLLAEKKYNQAEIQYNLARNLDSTLNIPDIR